MMHKRGLEMAMGTIVAMVLGLVILIILIIFAQQQVSKSSQKLGEIGKESEYAADRCQSIIKQTSCTDKCLETAGYKEIKSPTGKWTDCGNPQNEKLKNKPICCGKGEA